MNTHEKLVKKLQSMMLKKWLYKAEQIEIIGYEIGETMTILKTDHGEHEILNNAIFRVLNEFLPVDDAPAKGLVPAKSFNAVIQKSDNINSTSSRLLDVLMAQIESVENDPSPLNMKKAQTITNMVNSATNVIKNELSLINIMRRGA